MKFPARHKSNVVFYLSAAVCLACSVLFGPEWGVPLVSSVVLGLGLLLPSESDDTARLRALESRVEELSTEVSRFNLLLSRR